MCALSVLLYIFARYFPKVKKATSIHKLRAIWAVCCRLNVVQRTVERTVVPGSLLSVATHSLLDSQPTESPPPRCKCVQDYPSSLNEWKEHLQLPYALMKYFNPQATGLNFTCHLIILALRVLMSYICIYIYIYIYIYMTLVA